MEEVLKNFVEKYDLKVEKTIYDGDTKRNVNNPILFLFIGDSTEDAYEYIRNSIDKKWDNGRGAVFINVSTKSVKDTDNSFNIQLHEDFKNKKTLRKDIRDRFYSDKEDLKNLNRKITEARDKLLSEGDMFNSFDSINISVITTSKDPLNVILTEVTVLLKKRMLEVFKLSSADLYVLIKSQNLGDEVYEGAVTVGFFREVEYFQKDSFRFKEDIAVYGDETQLNVTWEGPLFYLTYVLEEKNEKGIIPKGSMDNNYEIISYINLIKNREASSNAYSDTENQYYDNNIFKSNISYDNSMNRYISAGLSQVKRPNSAIAISVLGAFYERMLKEMNTLSKKQQEFINEILKIDEASIELQVEEILPEGVTIEDMQGIMTDNLKQVEKKISSFNLREIEEKLYDDRCEKFFFENFQKPSEESVKNCDLENNMRTLIRKNILEDNKLNLYCAFNWTSEEGETVNYIRNRRDSILKFVSKLNDEIKDIYETRFAPSFGIKSFFSKGAQVKEAQEKIFLDIYGRKLEILKLNISKKILDIYEDILLKVHSEISSYINRVKDIGQTIKSCENKVIEKQDKYTAQNVRAYYKNVVNDILDKLEKNFGKAFYLEDKYLGNTVENLKESDEKFLGKIIYFCTKYILSEDQFKKSFEEEFNERANVNVPNLETKVLSKEELYRKLYDMLDKNSALKIYIMNYDVKPYMEKYFFGDYSSDFIKYAFDFDRKTRNYKIGYIDEIKSSGIEKLNLMGGFGAKDIIYVRNSMEFYNYCMENGYLIHGVDEKLLPEIN
ncbi:MULTISPECIES: hypothetical protein [Clostridium]|uniref:Uncharacterized protein n=2 Tax=Clostridium TaxID=1485 RepID=D8GN30_CLOLD|nr:MULTISPECIES: hypothetical protein [Clostridium]ADK13654.1 conserved hypothetical protein [Clostridium ljungdahlii DSM 13528]ALU37019.1 Hypothetical protein CLAU_2591 [Clostridium autoethanogenum DSM 10061]OAA84521.1 hypothetical protein WX45_00989 [Clostridium ljungdahlii DSM 13528]OVY48715.1 hypothetical protein WX72_00355 [Clostridium autoethanogenum]RMD01865.1 hypothetical protein D9O40_07405 [Clostridium autoethanogenum]